MGVKKTIESGSLVTFTVKVNGSPIPEVTQVFSVDIVNEINKIATATISILDGNAATETFTISSSNTFVPGSKISIEAGYNNKNTLIFEGIITEQNIRIDESVGSMLDVVCYDETIKMTVGRKTNTFTNKTDSDILSSIIGVFGLTGNVSATEIKWPSQIQYYTTDWDFIRARADANGLIVSTINGKVSVFSPDSNKTSISTITYGNNLYELNAKLNAINQLDSVKANSWNYANQNIISEQTSNDYAGPGNLSSKKLSEVVGLSAFDLQSTAPLTASELTNWSKAQFVKSNFSKIQGTVKVEGEASILPGKYITLAGVGKRFNGDHFVSGIHHVITDGKWLTTCTFGLSADWITENSNVIVPPASGLLPAAQGLFNGTVIKMYDDPDNQLRVLVDIPMMNQNGEGIWARLTNFYSTSGAGAFFMPEIGDEVVIGFLNEDPRYPIILGSMYSNSKIKPFEGLSPSENNSMKAIVSKSGIAMKFDDENKIFSITTPSKNEAVFSDKDKQVLITDQNGNRILMSESGIEIISEKDISIKSTQNLTLKGDQGVNIESSSGDVSISGININISADSEFKAQGGATAELSSDLHTTIKGAMVMIN